MPTARHLAIAGAQGGTNGRANDAAKRLNPYLCFTKVGCGSAQPLCEQARTFVSVLAFHYLCHAKTTSMMIDKSLKTLALLIIATTVMSCTQKEEYYGGSAVIGIKDEFFQDYADSVYTAGGRMATVVNTRERLEELLPRYANGSTLRGIDFSTSSFVYDSDTIIYTVHSDQPDWMTTYMVRGLSGNYNFQYYVSTQRADNATSDDKRRFIIGIVTEKLPDDAEVYVDKTLNYIDSTVHVYPHALSDLPLAE